MSEFSPVNQETNPAYNVEPGIARVPGSNYIKEVAKFEQFPCSNTVGASPGNVYKYRPFPRMLYRAEHWNGKAACMAAPPDSMDFRDAREYERAEEGAKRFTERCQRVVNDESEQGRAMEDGWREGPAEAVEHLLNRDAERSTATAVRNFEDRNMGEPAKREIAQVMAKAGGEHQPEIVAKPIPRRQ